MTRKPTINQLAVALNDIVIQAVKTSPVPLTVNTALVEDRLFTIQIAKDSHTFFSDSFDLEAMRNEEGNDARFDVIRKRIEDSISAHCHDEAETK